MTTPPDIIFCSAYDFGIPCNHTMEEHRLPEMEAPLLSDNDDARYRTMDKRRPNTMLPVVHRTMPPRHKATMDMVRYRTMAKRQSRPLADAITYALRDPRQSNTCSVFGPGRRGRSAVSPSGVRSKTPRTPRVGPLGRPR
jgi:hypothetical protein